MCRFRGRLFRRRCDFESWTPVRLQHLLGPPGSCFNYVPPPYCRGDRLKYHKHPANRTTCRQRSASTRLMSSRRGWGRFSAGWGRRKSPCRKTEEQRSCCWSSKRMMRGIRFIDVVAKTVASLLLNGFQAQRDQRTRISQSVFRSCRGCIDQICSLRRVVGQRPWKQ